MSIRLLLGVTTGHCMIGRISEAIGHPRNNLCRSCLDEKESMQHLIYDYTALQGRRQQCFGSLKEEMQRKNAGGLSQSVYLVSS